MKSTAQHLDLLRDDHCKIPALNSTQTIVSQQKKKKSLFLMVLDSLSRLFS